MSAADLNVFQRLIPAGSEELTSELANYLLRWDFSTRDHDRMHELADKSNEGTLTLSEKRELEGYAFAGDILTIVHARARRALKK